MTAPTPVAGAGAGADLANRKLPPIDVIADVSIALVVAGGILMVSKFPRRPPLTAPIAILAVCGALFLVNLVLLSRLQDFSWRNFFLVGRWVVLAYAIITGLIEFSFVHNDVTGSPLVVISLMLAVFAVNVALVISFTVARFQQP